MMTRKILITLPEEDAEWLDLHPEISKSGLFHKMVTYLRTNNSMGVEYNKLFLSSSDSDKRKEQRKVEA
jgi:hypothetical protein